ncbi:MAG: GTPase RsgA, partial [Deltaproteobacteria bacterium]
MLASDERRVVQVARRHVWVYEGGRTVHRRVRGGVDLVVGDRVMVDPDGAVSRRLPRDNVLERATPKGRRVLAANFDDLVVIVAARTRDGGEGLVARVVAAAYRAGAEPLILGNKADLDADGRLAARIERWRRLGFEALTASATRGEGLDALRVRLRGRVACLVGASGVGKSTLINALLPEAGRRVGHLGAGGRGRHTTTLATG